MNDYTRLEKFALSRLSLNILHCTNPHESWPEICICPFEFVTTLLYEEKITLWMFLVIYFNARPQKSERANNKGYAPYKS